MLHCLITIRMTACVESVCVCVCLIYIDAITPSLCHAFLHRHEGEKRRKKKKPTVLHSAL